jgi:hypothetical protein
MTRRAAPGTRPTFTVQALHLAAIFALVGHAIAAFVVGLVTVLTQIAAVSASAHLENGREAATGVSGWFPILMALVPLGAIVLSSIPWGIIILLCEIANDVRQIGLTSRQSSGSASARHRETHETLGGILQASNATAKRLERITGRSKRRDPADPPRC